MATDDLYAAASGTSANRCPIRHTNPSDSPVIGAHTGARPHAGPKLQPHLRRDDDLMPPDVDAEQQRHRRVRHAHRRFFFFGVRISADQPSKLMSCDGRLDRPKSDRQES